MAHEHDRYGRNDRWRGGWSDERQGRDSSIFSGEDRAADRGGWSDRDRSSDDDRGFFDRAGDEVRSWFGDDDAERRREMDMRRDESGRGRHAFAGSGDSDRGGRERGWTSGPRQGDQGRHGWDRDAGSGRYGGTGDHRTRSSHWDENYGRWRDDQLRRFDQEYEDYCRERQSAFDQDFDSWRASRLTRSGMTSGGSSSGSAETSAGGGGTGSATSSSTGSTGAAKASRTGQTESVGNDDKSGR